MLATTTFEMPMVALGGISIICTVITGLNRCAPRALRGVHLMMAGAMLAMLLRPGPVSDVAGIATLAVAAARTGRKLSATPAAVSALIDLLGMIVISSAMALSAATGMAAPSGAPPGYGTGGEAPGNHVLAIVGAVGAGLWIVATLRMRRVAPSSGERWGREVSVLSAVAMAAMLLDHM